MGRRIARRRRNVWDAAEKIMELRLAYDLGPMEWRRIGSSGPREGTLKMGRAALGF